MDVVRGTQAGVPLSGFCGRVRCGTPVATAGHRAEGLVLPGMVPARPAPLSGPLRMEAAMWLLILLIVLFVLALGGGGYGHSRQVYWSWSPAFLILLIAVLLFFTGHLSWHQ